MKWIRGAIILTVLVFVPSVLSMETDINTEEASIQVQTDISIASVSTISQPQKTQPRETHLRIRGKTPKTLHRQKGEDAFLECQAGGKPEPTVRWLKNGAVVSQIEESLVSDARVNSTIKFSSRISRLYIDCLSVEDEGHYSCVAENTYHRMSTDMQLTVSSSGEEVSCKDISQGRAPRMVQWASMLMITQGEPAKITCRADGHPRPTMRWLGVVGEELTSADFSKFQILPEGDLVIHKLEWSDMGTYECIAENVHGSAKAEIFLYPVVKE